MTLHRLATLAAAVALTVGLIGAGLGASYSDSATAQQNISVGTFGIEISSTVPGAVVSPDKHSVTFAAPMIVSSAANSVPFPFTVTSTGSVPVNVKISQTAPLAPFTSMLAAPVADVLLGQDETHEYMGGLQWPMLVNADLAKVTGITYTASATEGGATIIAVAPTVTLQSAGLTNGGITIPSVADLTYFINGTQAATGFNQRALGTYAVTAVPAAGHLLTGYPAGGWSLTVAAAANVRPITITAASAFAWKNDLYGTKITLAPAPVIDNTTHTVTYVIPITTASTTVQPGMTGAQPFIGNYQYTTTGTTVLVRATATVSASLSTEAAKFRLVHRNSTFGINYSNVPGGTLNVAAPGINLVTLSSRHNGGVGAFSDNAPGVTWTGVAGTGTVTIVLTFGATTP